MIKKPVISFKPKQVSKKLLSPLSARLKDIISRRYGLESEKKMTLQAIGDIYNIARERVRQIENSALATMKKSDSYLEQEIIFQELKNIIKGLGGVVKENFLLEYLSKDLIIQNHLNFYLVLGESFTKTKETDHLHSHWSVDDYLSNHVIESLEKLASDISPEETLTEEGLLTKFLSQLDQLIDEYKNDKDILHRYLSLSKKIGKNELQEWGRAHSSYIKIRGVKDYIYLILRQRGQFLHFKDIAVAIEKTFKKRCNVATCHNELIKDSRFVLVGRGQYALKEWGYVSGVVKDVIIDVLKENGDHMSKEEILKKVLEKRLVKPNTVLINLQNSKYFIKNKDKKYGLVKNDR